MRCYGLRAALLAVGLCAALVAIASLWLGLVGAAVVSALIVALGWITYFHSERAVLTALRARQVSEVERPELHRLVRELARSARLPMPRLFVSPAAQPNILTVGYGPRSAAVCCTEGLLEELSPAELRAVLAHELAHVTRRDVVVSSSSAGLASLVAICPLTALLLLQIASPAGPRVRRRHRRRAADRGAAGAGERAAQDRLPGGHPAAAAARTARRRQPPDDRLPVPAPRARPAAALPPAHRRAGAQAGGPGGVAGTGPR